MNLLGGDSAAPKSDYFGKKIWGVYIGGAADYIWYHDEIREMKVEGVLPIVVPPQTRGYWDPGTDEPYGSDKASTPARW